MLKQFFLPIDNSWSVDVGQVELEVLSPEYQAVRRLFKTTNKPYLAVAKIYKVINRKLLVQFEHEERKYQRQYGCVEVMYLFHGTKKCNIKKICANNFDLKLAGTANGCKYGKGVSFSKDSYYATYYGDSKNKIMFLVLVLISKTCRGESCMKSPPPGYDTTTDDKEQVYVKFDPNSFYPAYVIYYGKRPPG